MTTEALGSSHELDPTPWVARQDDTCCARAAVQDALYTRFLPRHAYDQRLESYGGTLVPDPSPYFCCEHRERHSTRTCATSECGEVLLLPRCGFITAASAY
jgi:hypothetical protein